MELSFRSRPSQRCLRAKLPPAALESSTQQQQQQHPQIATIARESYTSALDRAY
jgi:hypothetical protein